MTDVARRFWRRVDKTDTCWLWTGSVKPDGYGSLWVDGRIIGAHRVSYELLRGPIPKGHEIDHLCRVPGCVNPDHLEAVTHRENMLRSKSPVADHARRTHCPKGHPLSGDNVYIGGKKYQRLCRTCRQERDRAHLTPAMREAVDLMRQHPGTAEIVGGREATHFDGERLWVNHKTAAGLLRRGVVVPEYAGVRLAPEEKP